MDSTTAADRTHAVKAHWLDAASLAAADAPPAIRGWLTYSGLLSARMRQLFGAQYALHVVAEVTLASEPLVSARLGCADGAMTRREIEIRNGATRVMFAQSFFPRMTLDQQAWLARLGEQSLGEKLATVTGVNRGPLEFKRVPPDDPLARAAGASEAVWARRSVFSIDGAPILVTEVFLPELEQWNPS